MEEEGDGFKFGWGWIANTKLKIFHSEMMVFITFEILLGITCPLALEPHILIIILLFAYKALTSAYLLRNTTYKENI